ncbi:hypothetical protein BHM03_00023122 [Ensete ventricosum]|nr:hypothetical protein BHM03_00023122 [Ensete ventricosum]
MFNIKQEILKLLCIPNTTLAMRLGCSQVLWQSNVGVALPLSGSDDVVGSRRSSLGDSSKGSGSSLGTHWEIAGKRLEDSSQEGHRLPDWRDIKAAFLLPLLPSLSPPPIQEIPTIVSRQVKARQPYTLMAAIAFARLQEERLNHEARKIRVTPRPAMPKPSAPSTAI